MTLRNWLQSLAILPFIPRLRIPRYRWWAVSSTLWQLRFGERVIGVVSGESGQYYAQVYSGATDITLHQLKQDAQRWVERHALQTTGRPGRD